jgi:hypothetical protein
MSTMSVSVTSSPNFPGFSLMSFQFFRSAMYYAIAFLDEHALQGDGAAVRPSPRPGPDAVPKPK